MPQYMRVLYQFDAADEVELSVGKGEVVKMCEQQVDSPGWVQVEPLSGDGKEGFVPEGYIEMITAEEAGVGGEMTMQQMAGNTAPPPPPQVEQQPVDEIQQQPPVGLPPTPHVTQQPFYHNPPSSIGERSLDLENFTHQHKVDTPPAAAVVMERVSIKRDSISGQSNATGLVESFMKNEVYFRSLMKQRQETFMKLDGCINETAQEITSCKSKNGILAKKIRELDNMIEEDRAKWRSRIEEEKKLLLSQANTNLGLSHTTTTTISHTHQRTEVL